MTRTIGVAVQGAGWVATEHIRAYQQNPLAHVVAIGSRTTAGARRKADEFGLDVPVFDEYQQLLAHPGVDAVSICTPPERHCVETVLAARAGKHVLIEKPVALSTDDLQTMHRAVLDAGVRSVVSFVLRWNPALRNIKTLHEQGFLGDVFLVQTDYWHNLEQAGLGGRDDGNDVMITGGCHAVDAARFLIGDDVVSVNAQSRSTPGSASLADTVALLRFKNGAMAKVSACTSQWMPYQFNVDVFGTEGVVRADRFYTSKLPGLTGMATLPSVLPDSGDVSHHPFQHEIDHFIECVLTGQDSTVDLADAVNTHQACFAAITSSRSGGALVDVPLINDATRTRMEVSP